MLITRGIKDLQQTPQVISFEFYVDSDMHISLSLSLLIPPMVLLLPLNPLSRTKQQQTNKQTNKKNSVTARQRGLWSSVRLCKAHAPRVRRVPASSDHLWYKLRRGWQQNRPHNSPTPRQLS